MTNTAKREMTRYFVWRFDVSERFRAFGTRNYNEPDANDARCIWRGVDYNEAKRVAREANSVTPLGGA